MDWGVCSSGRGSEAIDKAASCVCTSAMVVRPCKQAKKKKRAVVTVVTEKWCGAGSVEKEKGNWFQARDTFEVKSEASGSSA